MELLKKIISPIVVGVAFLMILIMLLNYNSDISKQGQSTNIGLYTTYFYLIAAIVGIAVGFIVTAILDPRGILKSIIGVIVLAVIWGIAYAIAGNEVTDVYTRFNVNASLSKYIGSALILTYSLFILGILSIIYTEVSSAFK
ncbi:MAG: hypothetical protein HC880_17385 [Bacteroidia bacterium]|nr:hypothetical protein [Bacteroidia bacterium]